jgi:hypothetical protein
MGAAAQALSRPASIAEPLLAGISVGATPPLSCSGPSFGSASTLPAPSVPKPECQPPLPPEPCTTLCLNVGASQTRITSFGLSPQRIALVSVEVSVMPPPQL